MACITGLCIPKTAVSHERRSDRPTAQISHLGGTRFESTLGYSTFSTNLSNP